MRNIATLIMVLTAGSLTAQVATQAAPPPAAKPTFAQIGLFIYPAKGQTPEQQKLDEDACYGWAEAQTGITMGSGTVNTDSAAQASKEKTAEATQGAAVAGAAKGAAVGAAVGAIAGDAGKGAAIGAVAGGVGGRRAKKGAEAQAAQAGAQQATQANQQMTDTFKKAAGACMEGRGYTVK
jgi:hypothetical protein